MFLVDVNNPTGFSLIKTGKKVREEIIRYCLDYDKLLVVDFCFAPLLQCDQDCEVFDIYRMFIDSKVRYIAYEDTWKVRPIQDAKVAIIKCSNDIYKDLHDIKTSYILNVSPFILRFLIEYLRVSESTNYSWVKNMIDTHRALVDTYLQWTILEQIPAQTYITISWNRIRNGVVKATDLHAFLVDRWVYTLPWTYFFWDNHEAWEAFIRIALARDTDVFEQSMIHLQKWLLKYESLYL